MIKLKFLKYYLNNYYDLIKEIDKSKIIKFSNELKNIKKNKNKVLIFGNGAGAAIASHFSSDLSNTLKIKALSFDNSAQITCLSNDYGFDQWIVEVLKTYANKNDFIILLSASGNSKNMINAAKYLNNKKIKFISITGFTKDNKLNKTSKKKIQIQSKSYNHIEVMMELILFTTLDLTKKFIKR